MSESKNKLTRSDKTSFLALLLSISALVIGVVETRIMSQQQDTMVQQQKAAVWPYIEVKGGLSLTDSLVFTSEAENKGVGPAIVKEISIEVQGKRYNNFKDFSLALDEIIGKGQYNITRFGINDNKRTVYKPGESKTLFEITIFNDDAISNSTGTGYFKVDMVYCSIFDECWGANGTELGE